MTYRDEGLMIEMPDLERISARLRDAGGMLMLHAEDNTMAEERIATILQSGHTSPIYHARSKPPEVENAAIRSAIKMTRETGGRTFIVHLTTAEGTELTMEKGERPVSIQYGMADEPGRWDHWPTGMASTTAIENSVEGRLVIGP